MSGEPSALATLLERSAQGDAEAFAGVYDQVAGPVLGVARRVVNNAALAEEVAQDVLVEVWQSAHRYVPERGSAFGWVMTIAHRRAVDRVRRTQSSADREERAARLNPGDDHDQVAEEVEAGMERAEVRRCLDSLSELQQESVRLAYVGGLTYREVAEHLDTPLGTVKTRLRDALARLRDCLAGVL